MHAEGMGDLGYPRLGGVRSLGQNPEQAATCGMHELASRSNDPFFSSLSPGYQAEHTVCCQPRAQPLHGLCCAGFDASGIFSGFERGCAPPGTGTLSSSL